MKLKILLSIIVLFISLDASSQEDDFIITRLGRGQHALFTHVNDITQDKIGFLWLATENGLFRYDGYSMKAVTIMNDSMKKVNPQVVQVVVDSSGMLWTVGKEIVRIDPTSNMKEHIPLSSLQDRDMLSSRIFIDRDGDIWLSADSLYRFDEMGNHFVSYPIPLQGTSLKSGFVHSKHEPTIVWITSSLSAVYKLNKQSGSFETFSHENIDMYEGKNSTTGLFEDNNGSLWLGMYHQLCLFDVNERKFIDVFNNGPIGTFFENQQGKLFVSYGSNFVSTTLPSVNDYRKQMPKFDSAGIVRGGFVSDMVNDTKGGIWLAARGLYRFNPVNSFIKEYHYEPGNIQSISSNSLTVLYRDRSGVLWIGTDDAGVCKVETRGKGFSLFSRSNDNTTTFRFNVRAICEDKKGTIWSGSFDGLHVAETNSGLNLFPLGPKENKQPPIGALYPDGEGNIFIGGWGGAGVLKYDMYSRTISQITVPTFPDSFLPGVRVILKDSYGSLWIGTSGRGIHRLYGDDEHPSIFLNTQNDERSLSSNTIYCLLEDNERNIWVGTMYGLNKYERTSNTFARYFPNQDIRAIHEDKNGVFWLGTSGEGLLMFDKQSNQSRYFTKSQGLPDDRIYGILEDAHGNLWLGTHNGLCKFNTNTLVSRTYTELDGLQGNEFNTGAYFKNRSGVMYFGGSSGFNVFHPDSIKDNTYVPPVVITGFKIFDEEVPFVGSEIILSYFQNYFSFEFAALNYLHNEENQYAFIMEGFDRDWHFFGSRRFANYSHLDPGDYTFKIIASNNDDIWNTNGASIHVKIVPPFWMTTWFRVSAVLFILSVGPVIYYRRVTTLKKEKVQQEEFSRQLLDNVEGERKRIAGEIHDSLGQNLLVVKNVLQTGLESTENIENTKKTMENAVNIVGQTIQDARTLSYTLHPLMLEELGLTTALQYLLRKTSETFSIQHTSNVEDIDGLFSPEAEVHIFRIVQECLNNVVKHSGATTATLTVKRQKEFVELLLSDNGKGFDATKSGVHRGNVGGFGQKNMKERTRLLGAELHVTSIISGGTTVAIRCPIKETRQNG